MKNLPLALALVTTAFSASAADGTFTASNIIDGTRYYVYGIDGTTKLPKANGAVQFVFNGAVVGAGTYDFVGNGIFSAGTIGIPDQAGKTISLTIDVWDKTTGATFETAAQSGYYVSQTITITLGGFGNPPSIETSLTGYRGGRSIYAPEPSTVALAALGLGGLLFIRRRK